MRRSRKSVIVGCLVAGAVISAALAGGVPGASAAPGAPAPSHVPRVGPAIAGALYGVAATSAASAWAVGGDAANDTLVMHWNGASWKRVAAPSPDHGNDVLSSVSAASASDIWAVGNTGSNALVEHWNGKGWRQVPSPVFKGGASLLGVAAVSEASAWAVGASNGHPLIEHWNGRTWSRVPVAAPSSAELSSVAAGTAGNIWAVGDYFYGSSGTGVLIEHWNGKAWRRVVAPNPLDSDMIGVAVTSATSAWAVGDYSGGTLLEHTLTEHWDGRTWHTVASPNPNQGASLWAVAARSPSLAFAVGSTESNILLASYAFQEDWNGHAWREVTSPAPAAGLLFGVALGSAKAGWAVGTYMAGPLNGQVLIRYWNGTSWG